MNIDKKNNICNWLRTLSESTIKKYTQTIESFENYCVEEKKHGKIGMQQLFINYLEKLKAENYAGSTLQSLHSTLCLWYKIKEGKDLESDGNIGNKMISQLKKTQTVKQAKVYFEKIFLSFILFLYMIIRY